MPWSDSTLADFRVAYTDADTIKAVQESSKGVVGIKTKMGRL
jgi:hypothetical protein